MRARARVLVNRVRGVGSLGSVVFFFPGGL